MISADERLVVLAIVTTDRPRALERLIASCRPLAGDAQVAAVVLDNGATSEAERIVARWAGDVRGPRLSVRTGGGPAPLHEARLALTRAIAASSLAADEPVVWMLDDDLAFESLDIRDGAVTCRNVAIERIREVRRLAAVDAADVLVGGFTGDPPIRPDAVQATQLGDLDASVRALAKLSPEDPYPAWSPPPRSPDDYYDHAERDPAHLAERHLWMPRQDSDRRAGAQLEALCIEALRIPCGGTPFRPLLERDVPARRQTREPRRGGNTVFFHWEHFLGHSYPAIRLPRGWSRRSDMIGAALLARRPGVRVIEGGLTMRHHRCDQAPASFDRRALEAELAGVVLQRVVSGRVPADDLRTSVARYARERGRLIAHTQRLALTRGRNAIAALEASDAWWRSSCGAHTLHEQLRAHLAVLERQHNESAQEPWISADAQASIVDSALELGERTPQDLGVTTCVGG